MCEKCGKGVFFIIYLLIVLAGSIFVMFSTICYPYFFPDDSIFKDDKILINYRYTPINYYPELEAIYSNYSNNIYYQRKYDLSFSYNIGVIPIFAILSLVFGANFICCDYNKAWFIIVGIVTIISQVIPFVNKNKTIKKLKNLPVLSNYYEYNYSEDLEDIFEAYENYREDFPNVIYIVSAALVGGHFITWISFSIFKKEDDSENNEGNKKKARCTVLFHLIFGMISAGVFIFSPYFYYQCKNRYSDNFFPKRYNFTKTDKTWSSYYYGMESNYLIELFDYEDYPYLEEIFNIYYKTTNSKKNEYFKIGMNIKSIGIEYFSAAVGCLILAIISFILVACFKCKGKCHAGYIVIEILSMLLKVYIIFWPIIWIKNKYRDDLVNTNAEIKYIIDDYLKFSKCRNKFPIIIIIECVYLFFEIIIFLATFSGNTENTQNIDAPVPIAQTEAIIPRYPQQLAQSQTVMVIERERIIKEEVPHQYVTLKFKDNKNKTYEIEVDTKRRFGDVLNELVGKYSLNKNEIKSIVYGNRYLYLNSNNKINCLDTIEQLKFDNNTGFINITFEEKQNEEMLNLNKTKLAPIPKLHFCIINLESRKIDIEVKGNPTFENALENLKKRDEELKNLIFESIFYYDRGEKIYIKEENFKKNISELNILKVEIIFIKINYKDNITINFEFVWVNENNKRYEFSARKKETFHSVAVEFMGRFNEFIDNVITQFYIFTTNINEDDIILCARETADILSTGNPNTYKEIIETEFSCQFESLEKLRIDDGSEIFFETRKNIDVNPGMNQLMRSTMRDQMIMVSQFREQGNIMITFKTTLGDGPYIITVNEKEKFEEAIFKLRKEYPIFKDANIQGAMLNGENLFREEKRLSTIKDLQIKEKDNIIINVQTTGQ